MSVKKNIQGPRAWTVSVPSLLVVKRPGPGTHLFQRFQLSLAGCFASRLALRVKLVAIVEPVTPRRILPI